MRVDELQPSERLRNDPGNLRLHLPAAMINIAAMDREDGHHVVQGQEIHVNVVRPVTAELGFCLDMSHNTSVGNLDALWHSSGSTAELIESHIFR